MKSQIENGQFGEEGTITDEFGNKFPSGKTVHLEVAEGTYTPLVTGENITNVTIGKPKDTSTDYAVNVRLDAEGTAAFAEATTDLVSTKGKIVIILDDEVQFAPAVQSEILDGDVSITGNYTLEEAKSLQTVLESGSLPVSFEYAQSQVVGPTLGQDALASGVVVAGIGLAVVMLYLLVFYQGLGLVTAAAMAVFAVLYLGILAALSAFGLFSLSLAGIAGIVLTIGMAADSSILTMERFREEIRMGRSVRAASITGVKHAIVTSVDADLVTLVSALSLFFLASASVKGFGLTLALGIVCDIVMMLLFKAPLIRLLAPRSIAKHPGFWGVRDSLEAAKDYEALAAGRRDHHGRGRSGPGHGFRRERAGGRGEGRAGRRRGCAARAACAGQVHQARHQLPGAPARVPGRGGRARCRLVRSGGSAGLELRHRVRGRHVRGVPWDGGRDYRADAHRFRPGGRAGRRHPDDRRERRRGLPGAHDHDGAQKKPRRERTKWPTAWAFPRTASK